MQPRQDRLSWPDHHMVIAMVTAQRSPDPNTQVGACIVSPENRILGTGYNGAPRGLDPEDMPWDREHELGPDHTKYMWVVHAESNAILNSNFDLAGSTLYVTMYPCAECSKLICGKQISKVVYLTNPYKDTPSAKVSEQMLHLAGIEVIQHEWDIDPKSLFSK